MPDDEYNSSPLGAGGMKVIKIFCVVGQKSQKRGRAENCTFSTDSFKFPTHSKKTEDVCVL